MEIAEAIDILENEIPHCGKKATYTESELCEAYEMAICSLRAQHEQELNYPLTLDELREMGGEPVWLHTFSSVQRKTNIAQWAILESVGNSNAVFLKGGCNSRITKWFCNYGRTWLAHRHKPKEY